MGIETAILIGSTLLTAHQTVSQAEDEAQAVVDQAELQSSNKALDIQRKAASQQVSFLNSGLTLEGTPISAITSTFDTGLEDLELIQSNANTQSKNIISSARGQVISSFAQTGAGFASGGLFEGSGFLGSQGAVSRTIEFGSSDFEGPIQGFGGSGVTF